MNKLILIIVILAVIIITLTAFLFWPVPAQSPVVQPPLADIEIFSVKANDVIASPLKITGITRGNGWIGFEAQVGVVRLFDGANNELALGILTAQGEWMQKEINFETELTFVSPGPGALGSLVFYNENPSGDLERDKTFILPVIFQ